MYSNTICIGVLLAALAAIVIANEYGHGYHHCYPKVTVKHHTVPKYVPYTVYEKYPIYKYEKYPGKYSHFSGSIVMGNYCAVGVKWTIGPTN
ncbi:hypothetical protein BLOT_005103 [Blomia tropicalis]|nr:hypothetical protein BLOT_005103 [Blomia tropicalis]